MVCARNSLERSPTARHAPETAVLCGMSTHGLWVGPARRDLLTCKHKIPANSGIHFLMAFSNTARALRALAALAAFPAWDVSSLRCRPVAITDDATSSANFAAVSFSRTRRSRICSSRVCGDGDRDGYPAHNHMENEYSEKA